MCKSSRVSQINTDTAICDPPTTHAPISITPAVTVDRRPLWTAAERPHLPMSLTPSGEEQGFFCVQKLKCMSLHQALSTQKMS